MTTPNMVDALALESQAQAVSDEHHGDPWQSFDRSDILAMSVALEPSFADIGRVVVAIFGSHDEINGGDLVENLSQTIDAVLGRNAPSISDEKFRPFWRMFATECRVDFQDDEDDAGGFA